MPDIEQYDAIVLGTGEAGKYMAWHLGGKGKRVAAIERKDLGGACPNVACLPSKNVVHGAKVASYFQRGEEFGMLTDKWTVSMPAYERANGKWSKVFIRCTRITSPAVRRRS